jgi:prepilin-type N-terminal cleavage/methylation domain-containing protein
MKCHFKIRYVSGVMRRALRNTQYAIRNTNTAFTLVEVMTALVILAIISSSVLVVINRCMASAADSALRMQTFEVARDNMETLLSRDSVNEMVEYGSSDKHPEIQWKTVVETFYEPVTEQMWVRAICSAEYADTAGDVQTIELTHWLTGLTREQLIQMIKQEQEHPSEPNEPSEPNKPSEPNDTSEPNRLESEPNRPAPESKGDCDSLPFCESVMCHLDAGTPGRPTSEELIRYLNECVRR